MGKKIIFILTSSVNPNSLKRIDEFVLRGYNVRAYGFKRDVDVPNRSKYVDVEILGEVITLSNLFKKEPFIV